MEGERKDRKILERTGRKSIGEYKKRHYRDNCCWFVSKYIFLSPNFTDSVVFGLRKKKIEIVEVPVKAKKKDFQEKNNF
jgi:hypothetical protein